jgi:hypothetical protein
MELVAVHSGKMVRASGQVSSRHQERRELDKTADNGCWAVSVEQAL